MLLQQQVPSQNMNMGNQQYAFQDRKEKELHPSSGGSMTCCGVLLCFVGAGFGALGIVSLYLVILAPFFMIAGFCMCRGFYTIQPNEAYIMTFMGNYKGTVKKNGVFWINPFYQK